MSISLLQFIFASRDDVTNDASDGGASRREGRAVRRQAVGETERASVHSAQDAEWIRQIQSGDVAAFESLFAHHWAPLWRFARAETHSGDAAEDIVQSVFSRLWMRHATWDPQGSIQSYLFRAVRNAFADQRKHERVARGYVDAETPREQPMVAPAEVQAEWNDQLARLNRALAQLPDTRRQAVTLRYEHGLSYADIGAILGLSPGAVEKQIARTIETLRAWVTE